LKEEFLHHIWKFGLYNKNGLLTTDGEAVTVISPGTHNHHAGPDFFNARLMIGETTWVGNVEIHVNEKEWNRHGHEKDKAYDNVVLHVVYQADGTTLNTAGRKLPVVELQSRISRRQFDLYQSFLESRQYIPCQSQLPKTDGFLRSTWLERLLIERLGRKSKVLLDRLKGNHGDWQQTMFEQFSVSFGFKVNAEPMDMLARSIPVKLLAKYQHSLVLLEALLFGQAGLLEAQYADEYARSLQNEYEFLRHKHNLIPLNPVVWKFGRMRPHNFPTIRLAQLAALIHQSQGLFAMMMDKPSADRLLKMFEVSASEYWRNHHHFDRVSAKAAHGNLGASSREGLLINTVAPLLFAYSKHIDNALHLEVALEIMDQLAPEKNSIVRKMKEIGFDAGNAARSQALLELKLNYCDQKKCLNCAIGTQLLKSATDD